VQKTALIVDDDYQVRIALANLLADAGLRCMKAASAEEALALIDGNKIDLCVFDIGMPGMSGAELVWRVRQSSPELPVAALSGQLELWDEDDLAELGFARAFAKPVDCDEFVQSCVALLAARDAGATAADDAPPPGEEGEA
jgi:DNA-binding NtrC family response regulator